jgi:hypothetical protein
MLVAPILGFNYSHLQNMEKESWAEVTIFTNELLSMIKLRKRNFSGFSETAHFCGKLLRLDQDMLKVRNQRMKFPHFSDFMEI